ncbi:MAG TPA: peptide chain release factor 1 [Candidatus Limnocylindrales bacterium]|nr:peptide chain release factor 1 [Candidatus Limnocylindrales bacterium]
MSGSGGAGDGGARGDHPTAGGIEAQLEAIEAQHEALTQQLARPEVASDPHSLRRLGKELARLQPVVEVIGQRRRAQGELRGARELREHETDAELREMAREEVARLEADVEALDERLRLLLLPHDPNDEKDVIVEIRAGAGGEEAALFAAQLYRMYVRYAERHRWPAEVLTANETGIGGLREVIFEIHGEGAWSRLKFEGGVHRVQRVPETESSGRIHTSTATVAVLPEADEVEVHIDEDKDLRIEVKRSSGPGGQSVNTTDSAVRITHLPSGLVVEIQDEKSQIKNKAKALAVLRARLLDIEQRKAHESEAAARRSMVGSGDRSEKVRTYNFPQDRVTDHRIGLDLHDLPRVMDGDLDRLIDALVTTDQAERLAHLGAAAG